jgi:propionyl-CoA carboxylase beta chain
MIYAYAEATVPKGSADFAQSLDGGAYIVMSSKHWGGDINFACRKLRLQSWVPRGSS